jgi:outer membrane protein insertion porin family
MRLALLLAALGLVASCQTTGRRPTVPGYTFDARFEGDAVGTPEELEAVVLEELARHESERPTKADVDDAAFALELYINSRGHPFARVGYRLEDDESQPRATFDVQAGPQVRIQAIDVVGLEKIPVERALQFFGRAAQGGPYDERLIRGGVDALRIWLLDQGHLRASVYCPPLELRREDREVVVLVLVDEGPRLVVREVVFEDEAEELGATRERLTGPLIGQQHGPDVLLGLRNALEEAYGHGGWPDAEVDVTAQVDEDTGDVRLRVRTVPGERVSIRDIVLRGNERTREKAILPLLGIDPGDRYDSEVLRVAFRNLYSTGLFESVRISLEGTGPNRDLVIEVSEARSVQVRLEPGWGSYEGPRIELGVEEANFRGLGQRLSLEGSVSAKSSGARLGVVDPNFLRSPYTAEVSFFAEHREEPAFVLNRRGVSLGLRRQWGRDWTAAIGYEYRPTNFDDRIQVPLPQDATSQATVAELSLSFVFDQRDNLLTPTRGSKAALRLEWADDGLGSQVEFLRARAEAVRLFGLGGERVLATTVRTGLVAPFGISSEVPLPERFFNGGENSVRSFSEDELGPLSAGDPLGGESATLLSVELRQPLAGSLAGAIFADAGNVVPDWHDYFDFPGWGYGVGIGLRYLLPIGPVRLDAGFNPFAEDQQDDWVLHFSVGYPY